MAGWAGGKGFVVAQADFLKKIRKAGNEAPVVVAQMKTAAYLAGVLSAVEQMRPVVLANPHWGEVEFAQAAAQNQPGIWLGGKRTNWLHQKPEENFEAKDWKGAILIPTGGTGGRVRWAVHYWNTLAAAAQALGSVFGDGRMRPCQHPGAVACQWPDASGAGD